MVIWVAAPSEVHCRHGGEWRCAGPSFEAEVLKHPEIRECYLMTGAEDYLLRVEAEGAGDYERIHKEILSRLPAVSRINSSFAIRRVLSDTGGRR